MKKTIKIIIILSFTYILSLCISCFKTELKRIRIFDIELEIYNQNLEYLTEGDTCNCEDLKIIAYLRDENVVSLLTSPLINETYAFSYERYFDFTNEFVDINIYIKDAQNDSIDITDVCMFYFDDYEIANKEQLIESCNNKMDYYKINVIKWPLIDFSFKINDCYIDSMELRSIIVNLEMSDELIRESTSYINIENKN